MVYFTYKASGEDTYDAKSLCFDFHLILGLEPFFERRFKNWRMMPQGWLGLAVEDRIYAAEMLNGAAGSLVGIGSASPCARALARRYISLLVDPLASIAAATTAQLRISVVIAEMKKCPIHCLRYCPLL